MIIILLLFLQPLGQVLLAINSIYLTYKTKHHLSSIVTLSIFSSIFLIIVLLLSGILDYYNHSYFIQY